MTEKEQARDALVAKLQKFGIPTKGYARGPMGNDIFVVDRAGELIRIWPGIAETTVRGSSKHRQVVINAVEKRRTIKRQVDLIRIGDWNHGLGPSEVRVTKALERRFQEQFGINLPTTTRYKVTGLKEITDEVEKVDTAATFGNENRRSFRATVTATVRASSQSFLVGYDETGLFISALPKAANSVDHAHELLRPPGAGPNAVRQGEWFFEPAPKAICEALDASVARKPMRVLDTYTRTRRLSRDGWDNTHQAQTILRHKGKRYAIGWVVDTRAAKHHAPLFLADWHLILRNLEIESANNSGRWD